MDRLGDTEEIVEGSGLLGGITAYHLRILCESEWNGGGGYLPAEVGQMTLDQIWFRLCETEILKREVGGRTEKMESLAAIGTVKPDKDGLIRGRAKDGTPILGRIGGESKARRLMREEEAKQRKGRRRRKGRK